MNYAETIITELIISFDIRGNEIFWNRTKKGVLYAAVNCNDLFYWGHSDLELISLSDIPDIKAALTETEENGLILWCCRKRKMRPQTPYYKHLKGEEHLFDACGDDRNTALKKSMEMTDPEELGGEMIVAWAVIYVFLLVIIVIASGVALA